MSGNRKILSACFIAGVLALVFLFVIPIWKGTHRPKHGSAHPSAPMRDASVQAPTRFCSPSSGGKLSTPGRVAGKEKAPAEVPRSFGGKQGEIAGRAIHQEVQLLLGELKKAELRQDWRRFEELVAKLAGLGVDALPELVELIHGEGDLDAKVVALAAIRGMVEDEPDPDLEAMARSWTLSLLEARFLDRHDFTGSTHSYVRIVAARLLGFYLDDGRIMEKLLHSLSHSADGEVKRFASIALSQRASPVLLRRLADVVDKTESRETRRLAIQALARLAAGPRFPDADAMGRQEVSSRVGEWLRETRDPEIARSLIGLLERIGGEERNPLLLSIIRGDRDPAVKKSALFSLMRGLSRANGPNGRLREELVGLLREGKPLSTRLCAAHALVSMIERDPASRRREVLDRDIFPLLKETVFQGKNTTSRDHAIAILGRLNGRASNELLLEVLRKGKDPWARFHCATILGRRGDRSILGELAGLLALEEDPRTRWALKKAIRKLSGR
jgi:hypothetical protein